MPGDNLLPPLHKQPLYISNFKALVTGTIIIMNTVTEQWPALQCKLFFNYFYQDLFYYF